MAIIASDILFKFAEGTGPGNTNASTGNGSLGGWISTTTLSTGTTHDLFDVVSGAENAASTVDYRCVFVHNSHATLSLQNAVLWLSTEVAGGATAAIGLDTNAASPIGQVGAQALTVVDELTAPAGVTFTAPTTFGTGLAIGTLAAGECRAFWVRRTAANTAALTGDGVTFSVQGDTAA